MIYYREIYKAKSGREKKCMDEIGEKVVTCSSNSGVRQDTFNSPSDELWQHLSNEAQLRFRSQIFPGGRSCRHPLPSMYHSPRLPEGNQMVSTNHCFHKQFRHSGPLLSEWKEFLRNPSFQWPAKGCTYKQTFQI